MTEGHPTCPECGGKFLPIIYGYPGPKMIEAAEKGEVLLGGCVVEEANPNWRCTDCGKGSKDLQMEEN